MYLFKVIVVLPNGQSWEVEVAADDIEQARSLVFSRFVSVHIVLIGSVHLYKGEKP